MQLIPNGDGSITVSWTVPSFTMSTAESSTATYPPFNVFNPVPISSNSPLLLSFNPGTGATSTYLGATSGQVYFYGIIHTQFGTNTINTIKDFYTPFPVSSFAYQNPESPSSGFITGLSTVGGIMNSTIPASLLTSSLAGQGVYVLGYVGVVIVGSANPGFWVGLYEGASNSPQAQPQPPDAPGDLVASRNSNNQCVLTWSSSTPGSAPVAGYNIKWGTTTGVYTNSIQVAAQSGTQQSYIFPTAQFPFNGTIQYFTVQPYDNGSAPPSLGNQNVTGITYSPPSPIAV